MSDVGVLCFDATKECYLLLLLDQGEHGTFCFCVPLRHLRFCAGSPSGRVLLTIEALALVAQM